MVVNHRFIEESFPVKDISNESVKEKNIRRGHISTVHLWWARRPLASSRATIYAALIPSENNELDWIKQRDFIIELSKWENSDNPSLIQKAKERILYANSGIPPKVLDPYGGGGSIPLECMRLGCDTYSNDYNPVAVLIQKCTIEFPQKFGVNLKNNIGWGDISSTHDNFLIEEIRKWSDWVYNHAKSKLEKYYLSQDDKTAIVGYNWSRTIPCQNPLCGTQIPLMRQYWLANKERKKVAIFPDITDNQISFKIVGDGYDPIPDNFDPSKGTISRAVAICPICGYVVDAKTTRDLFQKGLASERIISVVCHQPGISGKKYRISNDDDISQYNLSKEKLEELTLNLREKWGIEPLPDEPTPEGKGSGAERAFSVRNYGINTWGDLFNSRQKLALVSFIDSIKSAKEEMQKCGYSEDLSNAIITYLAFILDRLASFSVNLCRWKPGTEQNIPIFSGRAALPMVFDYFEVSPIGDISTSWNNCVETVIDSLEEISHISQYSTITQSSATSMPYEDGFFDAIITDPPYYDNVPYSYLADFFYTWLKRTIGEIYPDLFTTELTPKKNEVVAYSLGKGGLTEGKKFFETMLKKSFQEIYRLLKPSGISIIVYAHKSTEGWETLINSLLDSGLIITGAWPLNTEMESRLRSQESASLASSIYIVARKMDRRPTGFYNNVKEELKQHLTQKLDRLWQEGISGADFFIAAIGSAIEVFGKYEEVMDYEGNIVRADRMLVEVRKIATDYAVRQILHNGFAGEISDLSRFYVLWRWNYGEAKVPFDEARKLGQSCGLDVAQEWARNGFILKEKEFVRVIGPQERKIETLKEAKDLIDVLHRVLLLWEKSKREEMISVLQESGYGTSEAFFRVAQAVSETLPIESKEKKLLDGFLAGRERVREEVEKKTGQVRLDV